MAITLNFKGMKIKFPSWSGPCKCKGCGSERGYSTGGEMPNGKPGFSVMCMDCPYFRRQNWHGKPDKLD